MRRVLTGVLIGSLAWALAEAAWGRVGGGETFGGGGASPGGGGDDGGAFLIYLLIRLVFEYPAIGIPLAIAVGIGYLVMKAGSAHRLQGNLSSQQARDWSASVTPTRRSAHRLESLRQEDPNFSTPLFLDFVNLLYTRVHSERTGDLASLAGYLDPDLRRSLIEQTRTARVTEVQNVLVGSTRITDLRRGASQALTVDLEANFTELGASGPAPIYSVERWTFVRRAGVLSKGPVEITRLACPSCGNPAEFRADGSCPFCDQVASTGAWAWVLKTLEVLNRVPRPRMDLRQGGQEVGTEEPTRMQPGFELRRKEFMVRHPDFSWPDFEGRVRHVFTCLQESWSQGRWELARPFETDHLFSNHRFWLEAYARDGLANRIQDVRIEHVVPVKIETDAWFDSLTVRIWASARDWTEEVATGKVVAGSREKARRFSEYWTFLRRSGFSAAPARDPAACPSCGAPLEIAMSGICPYCDSKITSGEFDWVLTRIEQDEAYEA